MKSLSGRSKVKHVSDSAFVQALQVWLAKSEIGSHVIHKRPAEEPTLASRVPTRGVSFADISCWCWLKRRVSLVQPEVGLPI